MNINKRRCSSSENKKLKATKFAADVSAGAAKRGLPRAGTSEVRSRAGVAVPQRGDPKRGIQTNKNVYVTFKSLESYLKVRLGCFSWSDSHV